MIRSAPSDGYDFGSKRHYRRQVWNIFRDACKGRLSTSHALLMPSAEGDEIDVALSKGFREENLHVVDRNPAIVAHLKRRYPKVNTYGVEIGRAAQRISENGVWLSVANLDLCGQVSDKQARTLSSFAVWAPMEHHGLVAVTALRGRESRGAFNLLKTQKEKYRESSLDDVRLSYMGAGLSLHNCGTKAVLVCEGKYKSTAGNQTMLWGCFRICCHEPDRAEAVAMDSMATHFGFGKVSGAALCMSCSLQDIDGPRRFR